MIFVNAQELEFVSASHENPDSPGVFKKVLATHQQLQRGQVQMVNWAKLPPSSSFQPHYHEDMQEVFVILDGTVTMTVEGEMVTLQGGDAILVEPREVHQMTNVTNQEVNYVVFGISSEQNGKTVVVSS